MGIWDSFSDLVEAVTPWSVVEAEAPAAEPQEEQDNDTDSKDEETSDEPEEATDDAEEVADEEEEGDDEDGDDEEEEDDEEDEEETIDPKEVLEEECKQSAQCAPVKHHFDECVERVQQQESEGEAKEDCVEEFFHLAHCATACAAPKLWSKLR